MNTLTTLFKQSAALEPRSGLREQILAQIATAQYRAGVARRRWALSGVVLSGVAFSAGVMIYGQTFLQSDFWTLLSLLFTDLSAILSASQDFLYSLLETAPVLPLVVFLFPLMALFWSLGWFFSQSETSHRFIHSVPVH